MAENENDAVTNETPSTENLEIENNSTETQSDQNDNENDVQNENYYPYDKNVERKEYTEVNPIVKGMTDGFKIPTVKIVRPVVDLNKKPGPEASDSGASKTNNSESASTKTDPINKTQPTSQNTSQDPSPFLQSPNLDYLEKRKRADRLTDMCLNAYAQIKTFIYLGISLDDEKMKRRAIKGKFDLRALDVELEVSGEVITVREFLDDYDRSIRKALHIEKDGRCHLDENFIKHVRPAISDFFYKKGYGVSEEGGIGYYIAMDLFQTATQLVGHIGNKNVVLHKVSKAISEAEETTEQTPPTQIHQHIPQTQTSTNNNQQHEPSLTNQNINEAEKAQANVHGADISLIKNNTGPKPVHSIPHTHQLAEVPGKRGRKVGSKDSKPRDNTNYLKGNRGSKKKQTESKSKKTINKKPKDELLEFVNDETPIELFKEA